MTSNLFLASHARVRYGEKEHRGENGRRGEGGAPMAATLAIDVDAGDDPGW